MTEIKKVLVIGSGPIIIGQAAEFDYSGTQACRSLREEGIATVLVNSNPATIMTDEGIADTVYIEPLTVEVLERIIDRERPDGLLPTLGGQTGLNLAVELSDRGILSRYEIRSLGTPIETIRKAENRELFKQMLISIGEPVPPSATVNTLPEAWKAMREIGLPVVIRPAYTLGGTGGGVAESEAEYETICSGGLAASPIHQVLIERCLLGWKELEYEVMRDGVDNCITICNMENIDPMGIHTGDSIVVAPSQTLTDKEYQMLRSASLKIIRALGIEGGCNIQFALQPHQEVYSKSEDESPYYVIEVNPRVSRSSALASKATGYPIARVAAKIATGKTLDEIPNKVTGETTAAFEPALDYCVVKIPRWPFDKFAMGDRLLGTQMKSTGETMAIERTFEAAFQKALRSLEFGRRTVLWEDPRWKDDPASLKPNDQRLWAILAALRRGTNISEICRKTGGIDPWFLNKFQNIVNMERRLLSEDLTPALLREAKRMGFPDLVIGTLADRLPEQVRSLRHQWGILPVYKTVDTCAAEFAAETPYFYSTYEQENEAAPLPGDKALVVGSGPIRIGQGIEFDYCSIHSAWALQDAGFKSIMVNSNPETVSTDFDTSDRLYFEPLDEESMEDILENETSNGNGPPPSILQFGGQTAINLAEPLSQNGLPLLGSEYDAINIAEDRGLFSDFLDKLGIPQPPGAGVYSVEEALNIADAIGYPVLVRPSYVLGGRAMEIVHNPAELATYMKGATELDDRRIVLIDKYVEGKEVEVDAICDGENVLIPGIMEHIERAGVHSGDSMAVYPALNLTYRESETIIKYTTEIGLNLGVRGLMNIQYVVMPGDWFSDVFVLEVNPRASRTVPFLSKVTGVSMVKVATGVMLGISLAEQGYEGGLWPVQPLVGVKSPVFSMAKLPGVDTFLGPEMKSTGEVMGIDHSFPGALIKALIACGRMIPARGSVLLSLADKDKSYSVPMIKGLAELGYSIYATEGTAATVQAVGIPVNMISKKISEGHPNVLDIIEDGTVDAVLNTPTGGRESLQDGFRIRRAATERRIPCFTYVDAFRVAVQLLLGKEKGYDILPFWEYRQKRKPWMR